MSEDARLSRTRRRARKAGYIVHKYPDLTVANDSMKLVECGIHGGSCKADRYDMEHGHWRSHASVWSGNLDSIENFLGGDAA